MKPEYILADHSSRIRALAQRLRRVIRRAVPEAIEVAYPTWHAIGYRHPKAGYFCGIFPYEDHIKIYFEHGIRLPDPHGVLEGDGRQTRYVCVQGAKDVRTTALKELLSAAINLPARRQGR